MTRLVLRGWLGVARAAPGADCADPACADAELASALRSHPPGDITLAAEAEAAAARFPEAPQRDRWLRWAADAWLAGGHVAEAGAAARRGLEGSPGPEDEALAGLLLDSLNLGGDWAGLAAEALALSTHPGAASWRLDLPSLALLAERKRIDSGSLDDRARAEATAALAAEPSNPDAAQDWLAAAVWFDRAGDGPAAVEARRKGLALADDGSPLRPEAAAQLALDLWALGRWKEAAEAFEAAAKAAPAGSRERVDAWVNAGLAWEASGEWERAIPSLASALEPGARSEARLCRHLGALLLLADRPADAARWLASVPRDPEDPTEWLLARRALGLAEEALDHEAARDAAWAPVLRDPGASGPLVEAVTAAVRADRARVAKRADPAEVEAVVSALRAALHGPSPFAATLAGDALGRLGEALVGQRPAEADAWRSVARDAYRASIEADRAVPRPPGAPPLPSPEARDAARRLAALGG